MPKLLTGVAALGLLYTIVLPVAAAERQPEGIRSSAEGLTEFSAHRRAYRHRHVVRRAYVPRRYVIQQSYPGFYTSPYSGSPYYRGWSPYGGYYAAGPRFGIGFGSGYYGPSVGVGFGFGPRWGW